jgi:3,4-dihydroxy 2-butanone 4-phosphate synthase/GTP cyclohydrolase II
LAANLLDYAAEAKNLRLPQKFGVIDSMTSFVSFLEHFQRARLGVLIDDQGPSRAALVAPAQDSTTLETNRVLSLSGGLTFVAISPERASALLLEPMVRQSIARGAPAPGGEVPTMQQYTTVEAREGVTTGISAHDRAITIGLLGSSSPQARSLVKPGHIFPVGTHQGGVLAKAAIPEGALDIVRISGFTDAALFVDLLGGDGELIRAEEARALAARENIPIATLTEVISYRLEKEPLIRRVAEARVPTSYAGDVQAIVYRSSIHDVEHIALVKGTIRAGETVLVRVQAENTLTDVFGGSPTASRQHLQRALECIGNRGAGVFLYLRRPHILQEGGNTHQTLQHSTSTSMMREYGVGAQILRDLGVSKIELLTTHPRAIVGLPSFGLSIVSQHPIPDNTM